jgi:NTP pyrophosphatase (non-canonical NTP hydrolase)
VTHDGSSERSLSEIVTRLREFVSARDWGQFHNPKNLAMAIASEAGELLAELRWVRSDNADEHVGQSKLRQQIENEVADIAIALLLFCDRAGIDLIGAIHRKIDINAKNYPIDSSRGRANRPTVNSAAIGGSPRIIAVDWSGKAGGGAKTIWLAEIVDGRVERLENGRNRSELADELIAVAVRDPNTIVGLDFAFSFPEWFVRQLGVATHSDLWDSVALNGEAWLRSCEAPFWGRPGRKNPRVGEEYRRTERTVGRLAGGQAKSTFQIGGAGAVGTGSIRGMPTLARLRRAGFTVWPFDEPRLPMAIEIYPRLLTGPVVKSAKESRTRYLEVQFSALDPRWRELGAETEDAFDALVSALAMWRYRSELPREGRVVELVGQIEGEIWAPTVTENSRTLKFTSQGFERD